MLAGTGAVADFEKMTAPDLAEGGNSVAASGSRPGR